MDIQAFYRALTNSEAVVVITTDTQGLITTANPLACQRLGYEPGELVRKVFITQLLSPDEWEAGAKAVPAELQTPAISDFAALLLPPPGESVLARQCTLHGKEGVTLAVLLAASPMHNELNQVMGYVFTGHAATGKEPNRLTDQTDAQLNRLIRDNTTDLIWLHYLDGTYAYLSPSVEKFLGYKSDELIGLSPQIIIHPDDYQTIVKDGFRRTVEEQKTEHLEYRVRRKDGEYIWLETVTKPVLDEAGKVIYFQTSSRDVTNRKRSQELLMASEARFRAISQTSPLGIFVTNRFGRINYLNNEYCRITGLSIEQVRGKSWIEAVHPDDREEVEKIWAYSLSQLCAFEKSFRFIRPDSQVVWVSQKTAVMRDAYQTLGFVGTVEDITLRKEGEIRLHAAYEELQASEEELRQRGEELSAMNEYLEKTLQDLKLAQSQLVQSEKMASLGQLTAGIAHEINNPINFVHAGVQNLRQSLDEVFLILARYEEIESHQDPEKIAAAMRLMPGYKASLYYQENKEVIRETIGSIEDGAFRTAEIVKGLRNFSRLDEAHVKAANIHEGLDNTLVLLTTQLKNRITIVKDYDSNLPMVECYPGQLNQVFLNILSNAVQAIEGAGEIYVTTRSLPDHYQITIRDTGKGMDRETRQRIFEPFFTTKPVGQGTGLGLAISYGIIQKHRGEIRVESEINRGTTFTMSLPKMI